MSRTALALRRILKAIGTPALSRSSCEASKRPQPRTRCLATSSSQIRAQSEAPISEISAVSEAHTAQRYGSGSSQTVLDLLTSIRTHLESQPSADPNRGWDGADDVSWSAVVTAEEPGEVDKANDSISTKQSRTDPHTLLRPKADDSHAPQHDVSSPSKTVQSKSSTAAVKRVAQRHDKTSVRQKRDVEAPAPSDISVVVQELARRSEQSTDMPDLDVHPGIWAKAMAWEELVKQKRQQSQLEKLSRRHDVARFPAYEEWLDAFAILKDITPKSVEAHKRVTQTFPLPKGSTLMWSGNPGEVVALIQGSTGCQLEARSTTSNTGQDRFTLTFSGTSSQTIAARNLILQQGLLTVKGDEASASSISVSDLLTSKPFTKSNAKSGQAKAPVPRPVWMMPRKTVNIVQLVEAALKDISLPPLQLDAAVHLLTQRLTNRDYQLLSEHFGGTPAEDLIANALKRLLSNSSNIANTMAETLRTAWAWLWLKHKASIIPQILHAHDLYSVRHPSRYLQAVGTLTMNEWLYTSVISKDIYHARFILLDMQSRRIAADATTWRHFLALTKLQYPQQTDSVLKEMHTHSILSDEKSAHAVLSLQSGDLLREELSKLGNDSAQPPADFIPKFLAEYQSQLGSSSRLTSADAGPMLDVLLARGNFETAFQLCDLLAANNTRLTVSLFEKFLNAAAAKDHYNADLAVEALRRFSPLISYVPEIPEDVTEQSVERHLVEETGISPRLHNRIIFKMSTYEKLFDIAQKTYSWNLIRVIWQHACCAGQVSRTVRQAMHQSLRLRLQTGATRKLYEIKAYDFWHKSFGIFAVGIGEPIVLNKHSSMKDQAWIGMKRMDSDLSAYGSIRPLYSISEDALAARQLDRQWLKAPPAGLQNRHGRRDALISMERKSVWPWSNYLMEPSRKAMVVPVVPVGLARNDTANDPKSDRKGAAQRDHDSVAS